MSQFSIKRFLADDDGTTAIEYAVIASGICLVIITGINALGVNVVGMFGTVTDGFN